MILQLIHLNSSFEAWKICLLKVRMIYLRIAQADDLGILMFPQMKGQIVRKMYLETLSSIH